MEQVTLPRIAQDICVWIADQVRDANADGVVVGMSGGVDSSLVAVLSHLALDGRALGFILPCHSSDLSEQHAMLVADKFGIKTAKLDLSSHFDSLAECLPKGGRVAKGNLKARLRMAILYYHSNVMNYLVAGTSNRSELLTGYFTKHGDGAADILPIAGLLKTQVWELAGDLELPQEIIAKSPSGDLWPGQTDEGELRISYAELDKAIRTLDLGAQPKAGTKLARVADLIHRTKHKRITPRPFRRETIIPDEQFIAE